MVYVSLSFGGSVDLMAPPVTLGAGRFSGLRDSSIRRSGGFLSWGFSAMIFFQEVADGERWVERLDDE